MFMGKASVWNKLVCSWVRLEPTGLTSVFGIKVQINKKVIRLVLPPSLSASLSLIHNASASLVLMLALALVLVYVLMKKQLTVNSVFFLIHIHLTVNR